MEEEKNVPQTETEAMVQEEGVHHHSHHEHGHHHGHHHGSRRHHRSSRSGRNNKRNKFLGFVRHNRKKLIGVGAALAALLLLVAVGFGLDGLKAGHTPSDELKPDGGVSQGATQTIQVEIPFFTKEVSTVHPAVSAYMQQTDVTVPANEVFRLYRGEENNIRLDVSVPISLSYGVAGLPDGYSVKSATLYVSRNSEFKKPQVFALKETETAVNVSNLRTGTQYYFRFDITLSNGGVTSAQGTFRTADTPCILSVEGINDVRDIGGWKTADGKVVKQGLLYRGTELDGAVSGKYKLTTDGVYTMLTDMGIRTDLDLRYKEDNKTGTDALGVGVTHRYYNTEKYSEVFLSDNTEAVRALFADLAKESTYPAYMHCSFGLDRTGTAVFLLQALLGVPEEQLVREYHLSSLHHGDLWARDQFDAFVNRFKLLDGDTMQAKAETYLRSVGITAEEMASIRRIFGVA